MSRSATAMMLKADADAPADADLFAILRPLVETLPHGSPEARMFRLFDQLTTAELDEMDADQSRLAGRSKEARELRALPPANRKRRIFCAMLRHADGDGDGEDEGVEEAEGQVRLDGLVLPTAVAKKATELRDAIDQTRGGASDSVSAATCGNLLWQDGLAPAACRTLSLAGEGAWVEALGELTGLLLAMRADERWLEPTEANLERAATDSEVFAAFFTTVSVTWQAVLAQPDPVLGLAASGGEGGGCARGGGAGAGARAKLCAALHSWEAAVNDRLGAYDAALAPGLPQGSPPVRLSCLPDGWQTLGGGAGRRRTGAAGASDGRARGGRATTDKARGKARRERRQAEAVPTADFGY